MKNLFEEDRAKGDGRPKVGTESSEVVTVVVQQLRLLVQCRGHRFYPLGRAAEMPWCTARLKKKKKQ